MQGLLELSQMLEMLGKRILKRMNPELPSMKVISCFLTGDKKSSWLINQRRRVYYKSMKMIHPGVRRWFFSLGVKRGVQLAFGIVCMVVVISCVQLQDSGRSAFIITSSQQEAALGLQSFEQIKQDRKISQDPGINQRVMRVAERLRKVVTLPQGQGSNWEVVVFEDATPNAFALPGGKIGVHTGILPITQNDAGLAAVMGHELAHVVMRHGGQRISSQMAAAGLSTLAQFSMRDSDPRTRQLVMTGLGVGSSLGVLLPYSRFHEHEADQYGMIYMARAGYDPREAIAFWERMKAYTERSGGKPPEFLSTHPDDQNRIARLQQQLPGALNIYQASQ